MHYTITDEMGRLWQTLLLAQWKEIFAWLPVDAVVYERRQEYDAVLSRANSMEDCTDFMGFMLRAVWDTMVNCASSDQVSDQVNNPVELLLNALGPDTLSALELMKMLNLKHRTAFRNHYLRPALDAGLIEMTFPGSPNAKGQKYRRKAQNPSNNDETSM